MAGHLISIKDISNLFATTYSPLRRLRYHSYAGVDLVNYVNGRNYASMTSPPSLQRHLFLELNDQRMIHLDEQGQDEIHRDRYTWTTFALEGMTMNSYCTDHLLQEA